MARRKRVGESCWEGDGGFVEIPGIGPVSITGVRTDNLHGKVLTACEAFRDRILAGEIFEEDGSISGLGWSDHTIRVDHDPDIDNRMRLKVIIGNQFAAMAHIPLPNLAAQA